MNQGSKEKATIAQWLQDRSLGRVGKLPMIPIQSELVLFHFKVSLRNKTQTLVEKDLDLN